MSFTSSQLRRIRLLAFASAIPLAALAIGLGDMEARPSPSPSPDRVNGVALGLFASDTGYDYDAMVDEIADRGATDVMVVVQLTQPHAYSWEVGSDAQRTATQATIVRTLRQINRHGMRATLMPIVRLQERTVSQWRGTISPDVDRWFNAYQRQLLPLAQAAQQGGAARFVVGSELSSMQRYDARWRGLIGHVRNVFHGRLTYSANWDAFGDVPFWDAVDDIGVTGYFPMTADDAWTEPREALGHLRRRHAKPVLLTEIGYPSHRLAADRPWDQFADNRPAPRLQANLYRRFCDDVVRTQAVDGYFAWNWFGVGGASDTSFTLRGKPAAAELERCLRSE